MMDFLRIHQAFKDGDLETLKLSVDDSRRFPNCEIPFMLCSNFLDYAICHSPLSLIRTLLDLGADPNYYSAEGFPSIITALYPDREDRFQIIEWLIAAGADVNQRGINDYTPLHYAASLNDAAAIELLVANGADVCARTRIDNYATPLEQTEIVSGDRDEEAVAALKRAGAEKCQDKTGLSFCKPAKR